MNRKLTKICWSECSTRTTAVVLIRTQIWTGMDGMCSCLTQQTLRLKDKQSFLRQTPFDGGSMAIVQ